nr:shikimate dehydrogenase [Wenxinia marina]
MPVLRLGLVGDNIAASQSPRLHRLAGRQNGRTVIYDRLIPKELGQSWDAILDHCAASGYRGVNITYPYKETVARHVTIGDPLVARIGAVNTVLFDGAARRGFNTDYSGFVAAYRKVRGAAPPGRVLMIGAGGVGRAVGFGLAALGAEEIRVADRDAGKADALCRDLAAAREGLNTVPVESAEAGAVGADGLINCTPVGMVGYGGIPLPAAHMPGAAWAFDAVYTPAETEFLLAARRAGLDVIPGYELFVWQGVDAWRLFTGLPLDVDRLRADLAAGDGGEA